MFSIEANETSLSIFVTCLVKGATTSIQSNSDEPLQKTTIGSVSRKKIFGNTKTPFLEICPKENDVSMSENISRRETDTIIVDVLQMEQINLENITSWDVWCSKPKNQSVNKNWAAEGLNKNTL